MASPRDDDFVCSDADSLCDKESIIYAIFSIFRI